MIDQNVTQSGMWADSHRAGRQLSFGDILRENRRRFPQRTAIVCGNERLSYPQLDDRVSRLANALRARGMGAGDRLLWAGQNCHRFLELLGACAKIGAVVCPANWRWSSAELAWAIDDLKPTVVVWQDEEIGAIAREARQLSTGDAIWVCHDDARDASYEELVNSASETDDEFHVDPDSPLLAIYTAAFEGRPGAALLSHSCLIGVSLVQGLVMGVGSGIDDIFLNTGPFFHIGDIVHALPYLHFGCTNVIMRRMDSPEAARLIEREHITNAYMYGPIGEMIADASKEHGIDISSLHAPPDGLGLRTVTSTPPVHAIEGYGQTEVGGRVTFSAFGGDRIGRMGRSSPLAQVRIFDPAGTEVAPGEVGEIAVRGPVVMNGYHNREASTTPPAGWRRTGDLGRREPDGSISFVGVARRMLKSGVENIYPAEVESVIQEHPAVRACAIIGIPDERWDQSVRAIVVVEPGQTVTEQEIIGHCLQRIASYKKPRSVVFVDELPMRDGSVDYEALDARYEGGGYPGY